MKKLGLFIIGLFVLLIFNPNLGGSEIELKNPTNGIIPEIYTPTFNAFNVKEQMTLSPLFTPDNAIHIYAAWLSKANTTIDLQNQYITQFDGPAWDTDSNPIVRELVAAFNRGVSIRVQVREEADSDDVTSYLLSLGISVRWMGSSTNNPDNDYLSATHNKMILIDDQVSIISSINFGENAFTNNREAGMFIQSSSITNYYKQIFERDWVDGEIPVFNNIHLNSEIPKREIVNPIPSDHFISHTQIPRANFSGIYNVTAYANPDNADTTIFKYLASAKESIYISMYTISRQDFVDQLIALKQSNPNIDIQVLISQRRVGASENVDTRAAAEQLVENLIPVYNSTTDDDKVDGFYHNKYWIIDGKDTFIYSGNWSPRSVTPEAPSYTSSDPNRDMGIAVHDASDIASFIKTEVWDKDVAVASAWELPVSVKQLSFTKADVLSGTVTLNGQLNGLDGATVSYRWNNQAFSTINVLNNQFSIDIDTTQLDNGVASIEVSAELNQQTFSDKVSVTIANYDSSNNWRVLLTEVLPNPDIVTDAEGEFIELTNSFPFDVLLSGWQVGDEDTLYAFPDGFVLSSLSSIIIARNFAGFTSGYGDTADFELGISLTNSGGFVQFRNHKDEMVDAIVWGTGTSPDGTPATDAPGAEISISRNPLHLDTNSIADFILATPSPKGSVPNIPLLTSSGTSSTISSTGSTPIDTGVSSGTSEAIVIFPILIVTIPLLRRRGAI